MTLGGVGQLAYIARPVVGHQPRQFRRRGGLRLAAEALAGNAGEMFEEQRDVLATLADRRQAQLGDIQAIHQVLAEASGTCFGQQVGLGRGNHPQVDVDTLVRAEPLQLLLL